MTSLCLRIRQVRLKAKMSQSQLGQCVGVHRSAVALWESPKGSFPSVEHLIGIARTTDCCFEWLATGRGPMYPQQGSYDHAVELTEFAHSEHEVKALQLMRKLGRKRQAQACRMLEALVE